MCFKLLKFYHVLYLTLCARWTWLDFVFIILEKNSHLFEQIILFWQTFQCHSANSPLLSFYSATVTHSISTFCSESNYFISLHGAAEIIFGSKLSRHCFSTKAIFIIKFPDRTPPPPQIKSPSPPPPTFKLNRCSLTLNIRVHYFYINVCITVLIFMS